MLCGTGVDERRVHMSSSDDDDDDAADALGSGLGGGERKVRAVSEASGSAGTAGARQKPSDTLRSQIDQSMLSNTGMLCRVAANRMAGSGSENDDDDWS